MQKTEFKIFETSILVFVAETILGGICSIVFGGGSFFSFEVIRWAIFASLYYLFGIWVNTRRYQLLTCLGCFGIASYMLLIICHSAEGISLFSGMDWKMFILRIISYIVLSFISAKQANKLMEEDSETVNVAINVKGENQPEDVDANIK